MKRTHKVIIQVYRAIIKKKKLKVSNKTYDRYRELKARGR